MTKVDKGEESMEPRMVHLHYFKLDADYAQWMAEEKYRYRAAQVKSFVKVNGEKVLFNWQMGHDIVLKKAEERLGSGVVE
ncbi:MAG: hypothetical protein IJQ89_10700 [Bacteroidales bacterium]|nr:hypothetical protein [Bacteroidales bacterium]